jgi:hypothetical protein
MRVADTIRPTSYESTNAILFSWGGLYQCISGDAVGRRDSFFLCRADGLKPQGAQRSQGKGHDQVGSLSCEAGGRPASLYLSAPSTTFHNQPHTQHCKK